MVSLCPRTFPRLKTCFVGAFSCFEFTFEGKTRRCTGVKMQRYLGCTEMLTGQIDEADSG